MAKGYVFISIGFKLILIVSLLLGISLGGVTILSSLFFSKDIERTLRTNTMERVELLSDKIETDLKNTINSGRLIAATMEGGLVYAGTGIAATQELLAQNPQIRSVQIITNTDGLFTITDSAGDSGTDSKMISSVFLKEKITTAFACETVVANISPEKGEAALAILFPYQLLSNTKAASIVMLVASTEPYITALSARELYTNYIVDSKGTLLAHNDRSVVLARPSLLDQAIVRDCLAGGANLKQMQFTGADGFSYIGSWKRFFDDGMVAISVVKKDTALEGVYLLLKRNILITVMMLCTSMFLLFFFSKSLTNPIKSLMAGATLIGKGDFSVKIPPTTKDEIGQLSKTFNIMTQGLAERDKIKNAFGKFVNKEVAERVLKGDIQLGGECRTATIMFSDIRSFTTISEKLTPQEVVEFLNEYMTSMVECVNRTHGVVDKFIGDAIMAIWGAPYSHGNDTENSINSALMMRAALAEFNKTRGSDKKPIIKIGIGINTGEIIAGQIGSLERMEYTCIGDAVNLASRIESLNKVFKSDILISEHAYTLIHDVFRTVPMKKIMVKGKETPQQIYAVLGRRDDPSSFTSLSELRAYLGLENISLDAVDPDKQEEKYEVIN